MSDSERTGEQWEAVQESRGSSKAGRVGVEERSQPGRLFGPGRRVGLVGPRGIQVRSLANLAVWLDQEEELVQLVPEEFKSGA
jgi:hypothetical protein